MKITRNASAPSKTGAVPDNFTGSVRVDNMVMTEAPSRVTMASVTFAPGARTVWHTHPAGQTIIITAEQGWVQRADGPTETVSPGDTVFFAAGEKHWHGATAAGEMADLRAFNPRAYGRRGAGSRDAAGLGRGRSLEH